MIKKCSKCKATFECSCEKEGCWCEEVFVSVDTLAKLRQDFENCLCFECLKEYSTKPADFRA